MSWTTPADIAMVVVLSVALHTDLSRRRVPNLLTFGGMLLGLSLGLFTEGLREPGLGIGVALAFMFPGWVLGGAVRAGDAKLLMAIGALGGPELAARACFLTYLFNIPFGLVVLWSQKRMKNLVPAIKAGVRRGMGSDLPAPTLTKVAFVPVIALAVVCARATEVYQWPL